MGARASVPALTITAGGLLMKLVLPAISVTLAVSASGCANLERSRDLANPKVPPTVTGMQVCSNCHGVDGNSVSPNFPRLANQPKEYLANELRNFKTHNRSNLMDADYMWGMSKNLTPEQIDGLAEYFSKQTAKPIPARDAQRAELGRKIFEQGIPEKKVPPCEACHGPRAQGFGSMPRLASQHMAYLVREMHEFKETEGRAGTPMTSITHLLDPRDMETVAIYLQGLP